jgi:glycosyltransferase involved in cell wall biosynthesis
MYRLFGKLQPDVVHTHNWNAWPDALMAAQFAGCATTVQTFHGFVEDMPLRRRITGAILGRMTNHLTVVSGSLVGDASMFCRMSKSSFKVIRNGIDCAHFKPNEDGGRPARQEDSKVSYWCTVVGSLTPAKDPVTMLQALKEMPDHIGLIWVGAGPLASKAERMSKEIGISHRVHWAGNQTDVRPWLSASDIVVSSSRSEAFPLSILEAMAMRRPVVATRVGGLAEAITSGENGILVNSGQPEELSKAIMALLDDQAMRERLGTKARQRVKQAFNIETMVNDYELLYFDRQQAQAPCPGAVSA